MEGQTFSVRESLLDLCIFKNLIATTCISVCVYIYIYLYSGYVHHSEEIQKLIFSQWKNCFSTFLSSTLVHCFSASMRTAFFHEQMPHSAKTFEIFPFGTKVLPSSWVNALKILLYLCGKRDILNIRQEAPCCIYLIMIFLWVEPD